MNAMVDRPFGAPLDIELDLPVPPSVNRTRKINWAAKPLVDAWIKQSDLLLTESGQYRAAKNRAIKGEYELTIIFDEKQCKHDPDNPIKAPIDYLRRLGLIENDSPKYARRIVIEWGYAPRGCRLILKAREPSVQPDAWRSFGDIASRIVDKVKP